MVFIFIGYAGVAEEGDLTVFQEVDLMCEERELWCEVKAWKTLVTDNEEVGSERCELTQQPATLRPANTDCVQLKVILL